jgi:hypothetical protein
MQNAKSSARQFICTSTLAGPHFISIRLFISEMLALEPLPRHHSLSDCLINFIIGIIIGFLLRDDHHHRRHHHRHPHHNHNHHFQQHITTAR